MGISNMVSTALVGFVYVIISGIVCGLRIRSEGGGHGFSKGLNPYGGTQAPTSGLKGYKKGIEFSFIFFSIHFHLTLPARLTVLLCSYSSVGRVLATVFMGGFIVSLWLVKKYSNKNKETNQEEGLFSLRTIWDEATITVVIITLVVGYGAVMAAPGFWPLINIGIGVFIGGYMYKVRIWGRWEGMIGEPAGKSFPSGQPAKKLEGKIV